jgi:ABC-type polysaccharide/polyol phosphate export systems, permease component
MLGRVRMFQPYEVRSWWDSAYRALEVIYYSTVRSIRQTHGNPIIGLVIDIITIIVLCALLYFMFTLMGRSLVSKVRGDLILFLLSGIFLFLLHNKSVGAVLGSDGPTSSMMLHQPLSTVLLIAANAIAVLYQQTLVALFILFVYHTGFKPITIEQPVYAYGMMLLAWFTGIAVGVLLFALKPWMPRVVTVISQVYRRANMIASGKMVVANALPASVIAVFDWNPLFHCIDQARGFTFLNYNPHHSSVSYPLLLGVTLIMLGLIGEYYTRRMASLHWQKGF